MGISCKTSNLIYHKQKHTIKTESKKSSKSIQIFKIFGRKHKKFGKKNGEIIEKNNEKEEEIIEENDEKEEEIIEENNEKEEIIGRNNIKEEKEIKRRKKKEKSINNAKEDKEESNEETANLAKDKDEIELSAQNLTTSSRSAKLQEEVALSFHEKKISNIKTGPVIASSKKCSRDDFTTLQRLGSLSFDYGVQQVMKIQNFSFREKNVELDRKEEEKAFEEKGESFEEKEGESFEEKEGESFEEKEGESFEEKEEESFEEKEEESFEEKEEESFEEKEDESFEEKEGESFEEKEGESFEKKEGKSFEEKEEEGARACVTKDMIIIKELFSENSEKLGKTNMPYKKHKASKDSNNFNNECNLTSKSHAKSCGYFDHKRNNDTVVWENLDLKKTEEKYDYKLFLLEFKKKNDTSLRLKHSIKTEESRKYMETNWRKNYEDFLKIKTPRRKEKDPRRTTRSQVLYGTGHRPIRHQTNKYNWKAVPLKVKTIA